MIHKNIKYIPFGTRCSSAMVLKEYLHKRGASLPLDWIDIPLKSIPAFIPDSKEGIALHVEKIFSSVKGQRHEALDIWFVHDFSKHGEPSDRELSEIKFKYTRRFERLFDILKDETATIVTLTIIPHMNDENIKAYKLAVNKLSLLTDSPIYPIVINLKPVEYVFGEINMVVPFNDNWDTFHKEIAGKLLSDKETKEFFE